MSPSLSAPAAPRWWTPVPVQERRPWWGALPGARQAAAWQAQREHRALRPHWAACARDTLAPDADATAALAQGLERAREACRRAAARGDALRQRQARLQALPWLAWACEQALGRRPEPEVMAAAWALGQARALEISDTASRRLALALAAVLAAWEGKPCHVVMAGNEQVREAAATMAPLFALCGLGMACADAHTAPQELVGAYHADVLYATARRLVTDHCRDLRLRRGIEARLRWELQQAAAGSTRLLTRGLHTALVDDLDCVLADDALTPVVMAVADEGPQLPQAAQQAGACAEQLEPALHYQPRPDGGVEFTEAGLHRLCELASGMPPLWRSQARCQVLVAQALYVRRHLQAGRDYVLRDGGVEFLTESWSERLPQGVEIFGLTQALEAAGGRKPTPPARTVERMALPTFFNKYRRLSGAAPCLDGLQAELWRRHGLLASRAGACSRTAATPSRLWLPHPQAPQAALEPLLQAALVQDHAVLLVTRSVAQARDWTAWHEHPDVAIAAGAATLPAALARLAQGPQRSGVAVLLQEPLDSVRAETALARRAAGAARAPATLVRAATCHDRVLHEQLGRAAAWLSAVVGSGPRRTELALPVLVRAAQRLAQARARRRRQALALREMQVSQQLSFSGASRLAAVSAEQPSPAASPDKDSHAPSPVHR